MGRNGRTGPKTEPTPTPGTSETEKGRGLMSLQRSTSFLQRESRPLAVSQDVLSMPTSPRHPGSPTSPSFTQFWSMDVTREGERPRQPLLRNQTTKSRASQMRTSTVFVTSPNLQHIDEFSFEQVRELFSANGHPTVHLKFIHKAWDVVKKVCKALKHLENPPVAHTNS